ALPSGRAGVMIRETLDAASSNAFMHLYNGSARFAYRPSTGAGPTTITGATVGAPYWVKLTRLGNAITGYTSPDGVNWTAVGSTTIAMAQSVYVGLAVTAQDTSHTITATFDNVSTINGQDFLLTVLSPAAITGSSIQYTVNVDALGEFSGSVALSVSGLPAGATSSFSPSSLSSGNSILTVTPAGNTPANSYPLVITGTSGTVTHTSAAKLMVTGNPLGLWADTDVGSVGAAGNAGFNGTTFTVSGAGYEIDYFGSDGFHFVYQPLNGDGTVVARIAALPSGRAGVMIRETLDAASSNAFMHLYNGSARFAYRPSTGAGPTTITGAAVGAPYWVKLTRLGSAITGYTSPDGMNWTAVGSTTIAMAQSVFAGLAVTAQDTSHTITATFDNVSTINGQDFLLTVLSPAVITGSGIQYTVNVDALGGFSGSVALSVSGLPAGATSSFSPSSLNSG